MSDKEVDGLSVAITAGISNHLKDTHTALPGIIDSFDVDTQLATVQPAIKRIIVTADGGREEVDLPQLINVPVCFPGGGGFHITFPVKRGDECLVVFSERSIDRWYNDGGVQPPGALRFHSLSDGVALVGISSRPNKISGYSDSDVAIRNADNTASVSIDASGTVTIKASDIVLDGNVSSTGTFENNGINIGSTHIHTQAPDSDGDVQQPTGPPQ